MGNKFPLKSINLKQSSAIIFQKITYYFYIQVTMTVNTVDKYLLVVMEKEPVRLFGTLE